MSLQLLLDRSLAVQRSTTLVATDGSSPGPFATVVTRIEASVAPASAMTVANYGRLNVAVDHHVYTTANLDALIPTGPRLGDRLSDGTGVYVIKAVKKFANLMVSREVLYQVDCERVV